MNALMVEALTSFVIRGQVPPPGYLTEASMEELEAADLCECGQRLSTHPPLPIPKPLESWASRRSFDKDGRPRSYAPTHPWGAQVAFAAAEPRLPRPPRNGRCSKGGEAVTPRMRQTLGLLKANNGNKSRTATQLGITVQAVQQMVYRAREMGIEIA